MSAFGLRFSCNKCWRVLTGGPWGKRRSILTLSAYQPRARLFICFSALYLGGSFLRPAAHFTTNGTKSQQCLASPFWNLSPCLPFNHVSVSSPETNWTSFVSDKANIIIICDLLAGWQTNYQCWKQLLEFKIWIAVKIKNLISGTFMLRWTDSKVNHQLLPSLHWTTFNYFMYQPNGNLWMSPTSNCRQK